MVGIKDWFGGGNRGGKSRVKGGAGRRDGGRPRERERHQPTEMIPAPGQAPRAPGHYHRPLGPAPAPAAPPSNWGAPPAEQQRAPDVSPRAPRMPQYSPEEAPVASPSHHGATDANETRIGPLPAAARGQLVGILIAIEGDDLVGEVFKLFDGENKLGRGKDCPVKLPSEFISREHALLIHQEGVFAIRPLKEENPVLVNGEKTEGAALHDGDLVRLGRTTFRFRTA